MARSHDFRPTRDFALGGKAPIPHDPEPARGVSLWSDAPEHAHPSLESILHFSGFSLSVLEADPAVIYILRPDLRILYCNLAWDKFAETNDGKNLNRAAVVGTSIMDVVSEHFSNFYESAFAIVKDTARIWEHSLECSSTLYYRLLRMRVLRLFDAHLLIENSLRIEAPRDFRTPLAAVPSSCLDEQGIVTMCCHCRRTRTVSSGEIAVSDWVRHFLAQQPARFNTSICHICRSQFLAP